MGTLASPETERKFSREEFYAMIDAGIFDDDYKVELVDGRIISEMAPLGGEHSWSVDNLTLALMDCVRGTEYFLRVQGGIALPGDRELQPDLAVYRRTPEKVRKNPGPHEILLVVEVADSSLRKDLTAKMELYAEAGIPVYWVVDLRRKQVHVHTSPEDSLYAETSLAKPGDKLEVCGRELAVADIF